MFILQLERGFPATFRSVFCWRVASITPWWFYSIKRVILHTRHRSFFVCKLFNCFSSVICYVFRTALKIALTLGPPVCCQWSLLPLVVKPTIFFFQFFCCFLLHALLTETNCFTVFCHSTDWEKQLKEKQGLIKKKLTVFRYWTPWGVSSICHVYYRFYGTIQQHWDTFLPREFLGNSSGFWLRGTFHWRLFNFYCSWTCFPEKKVKVSMAHQVQRKGGEMEQRLAVKTRASRTGNRTELSVFHRNDGSSPLWSVRSGQEMPRNFLYHSWGLQLLGSMLFYGQKTFSTLLRRKVCENSRRIRCQTNVTEKNEGSLITPKDGDCPDPREIQVWSFTYSCPALKQHKNDDVECGWDETYLNCRKCYDTLIICSWGAGCPLLSGTTAWNLSLLKIRILGRRVFRLFSLQFCCTTILLLFFESYLSRSLHTEAISKKFAWKFVFLEHFFVWVLTLPWGRKFKTNLEQIFCEFRTCLFPLPFKKPQKQSFIKRCWAGMKLGGWVYRGILWS